MLESDITNESLFFFFCSLLVLPNVTLLSLCYYLQLVKVLFYSFFMNLPILHANAHRETYWVTKNIFWVFPIDINVVFPCPQDVKDDSDGCGAKFSVLVVSDKFQGKPLLARHRWENTITNIHRRCQTAIAHWA